MSDWDEIQREQEIDRACKPERDWDGEGDERREMLEADALDLRLADEILK